MSKVNRRPELLWQEEFRRPELDAVDLRTLKHELGLDLMAYRKPGETIVGYRVLYEDDGYADLLLMRRTRNGEGFTIDLDVTLGKVGKAEAENLRKDVHRTIAELTSAPVSGTARQTESMADRDLAQQVDAVFERVRAEVGADIAVFIVWDEVRPGRERRAIRVLAAVREYFEELEEKGDVEGAVVGIVGPAAQANIGGFFVVRGSQEQLREVRDSKEFRRLMARMKLVVDNLRVVQALLGGEFLKHLKELAADIDDLEK